MVSKTPSQHTLSRAAGTGSLLEQFATSHPGLSISTGGKSWPDRWQKGLSIRASSLETVSTEEFSAQPLSPALLTLHLAQAPSLDSS